MLGLTCHDRIEESSAYDTQENSPNTMRKSINWVISSLKEEEISTSTDALSDVSCGAAGRSTASPTPEETSESIAFANSEIVSNKDISCRRGGHVTGRLVPADNLLCTDSDLNCSETLKDKNFKDHSSGLSDSKSEQEIELQRRNNIYKNYLNDFKHLEMKLKSCAMTREDSVDISSRSTVTKDYDLKCQKTEQLDIKNNLLDAEPVNDAQEDQKQPRVFIDHRQPCSKVAATQYCESDIQTIVQPSYALTNPAVRTDDFVMKNETKPLARNMLDNLYSKIFKSAITTEGSFNQDLSKDCMPGATLMTSRSSEKMKIVEDNDAVRVSNNNTQYAPVSAQKVIGKYLSENTQPTECSNSFDLCKAPPGKSERFDGNGSVVTENRPYSQEERQVSDESPEFQVEARQGDVEVISLEQCPHINSSSSLIETLELRVEKSDSSDQNVNGSSRNTSLSSLNTLTDNMASFPATGKFQQLEKECFANTMTPKFLPPNSSSLSKAFLPTNKTVSEAVPHPVSVANSISFIRYDNAKLFSVGQTEGFTVAHSTTIVQESVCVTPLEMVCQLPVVQKMSTTFMLENYNKVLETAKISSVSIVNQCSTDIRSDLSLLQGMDNLAASVNDFGKLGAENSVQKSKSGTHSPSENSLEVNLFHHSLPAEPCHSGMSKIQCIAMHDGHNGKLQKTLDTGNLSFNDVFLHMESGETGSNAKLKKDDCGDTIAMSQTDKLTDRLSSKSDSPSTTLHYESTGINVTQVNSSSWPSIKSVNSDQCILAARTKEPSGNEQPASYHPNSVQMADTFNYHQQTSAYPSSISQLHHQHSSSSLKAVHFDVPNEELDLSTPSVDKPSKNQALSSNAVSTVEKASTSRHLDQLGDTQLPCELDAIHSEQKGQFVPVESITEPKHVNVSTNDMAFDQSQACNNENSEYCKCNASNSDFHCSKVVSDTPPATTSHSLVSASHVLSFSKDLSEHQSYSHEHSSAGDSVSNIIPQAMMRTEYPPQLQKIRNEIFQYNNTKKRGGYGARKSSSSDKPESFMYSEGSGEKSKRSPSNGTRHEAIIANSEKPFDSNRKLDIQSSSVTTSQQIKKTSRQPDDDRCSSLQDQRGKLFDESLLRAVYERQACRNQDELPIQNASRSPNSVSAADTDSCSIQSTHCVQKSEIGRPNSSNLNRKHHPSLFDVEFFSQKRIRSKILENLEASFRSNCQMPSGPQSNDIHSEVGWINTKVIQSRRSFSEGQKRRNATPHDRTNSSEDGSFMVT